MKKSWFILPALLGLTLALAQNTVQGAGQLAGGDAALGKTYTLYLGTPDALNFTLNKVEYLQGRFLTDPGTNDERDYLRESGKKLVVLHYSVQNPQKKDYNFRVDYSLKFTGIDSNNKELGRVRGSLAYDEITRKYIAMTLKPAQKVNLISILEIDSRASLPKLMVETNKQTKAVWRYDLSGKIAPLKDPFVDPTLKDGSASLDTGIPLKLNVYLPAREVDFKVTDAKYSTEPLLGKTAPAEGRLLLVNITFRNPHFNSFKLGNAFPPVRMKVFDQDDLAGGEVSKFFLASRDQDMVAELAMNKEINARFVVTVPAGMEPKRLEFTDANKRTYNFDLSNIK